MKIKNGGNKNKNQKKVPKETIKSCVDDFQDQEWPSIDKEVNSKIFKFLKKALMDLKKSVLEEAEQNSTKSPKSLTPKLSDFIIFGYNAVMRKLEENNLNCVLVDSNTKPDFLAKSFLPVCKFKSIPLIPIHDLKGFLMNCGFVKAIAIGLTTVACEKGGQLHDLYTFACQLLECSPRSHKPNSSEQHPDSTGVGNGPVHNSKCVDIQKLHLKRTSLSSSRVFKPKKPEPETECAPSFIRIKSSTDYVPAVTKDRNDKSETKRPVIADVSEICSFFIDTGNNSDEEIVGGVEVKRKAEGNLIPSEENSEEIIEGGGGVKRKAEFKYIPTRIKRVKRNKNKKKKPNSS